MAMQRVRRVTAALLVAAILLCFAIDFTSRTPRSQSPLSDGSHPHAANGEPVEAEDVTDRVTSVADPATESQQRLPVVDDPSVDLPAIADTRVLRVILEGITEVNAPMTTITLTGVRVRDENSERGEWPSNIRDAWPCQGLTSEFDLGPFFASVAEHHLQVSELKIDELVVDVDHPQHLLETIRIPLSGGVVPGDMLPGRVEDTAGQTVYEARVRLARPEFWPEFTLDVRDAHTRAHLEEIELRIRPGPGMALWGRNGTSTMLGDGLRSPIALMGVHAPDEVTVAGMAHSPAAGELPRLVELPRRWPPERGVIVSARAPGYAWGSISLDVSEGERELLLEPAATLDVRLTNMQLERYAALETEPMLGVYRIREDGGSSYVHFEPLHPTLETEGLRLESLVPGGYRVAVELGGESWTKRPVLALEELSGELALSAGETRELVLTLTDPPAPPARATLGGRISFAAPTASWGEEKARFQLYFQPAQRWRKPDVEFSLTDLQRVGGALPTWSFRAEDLPVGLYRAQLLPFLKVWMIDLPAAGREDVKLVLPELAEVLVETIDGQTGERVTRDALYYRNEEPLPRQRQSDFARADTEGPGRFRFWAAPGKVMVWPKFPTGADRDPGSGRVLELIPGLQSVRLELPPVYAIRFEFREDGVTRPVGDPGMSVMQNIRAVGHEGRVTRDGLQSNMRVEVSAAGAYEISFEGLDADRYHPIPPRSVDVHAGETAEVIVELHRK